MPGGVALSYTIGNSGGRDKLPRQWINDVMRLNLGDPLGSSKALFRCTLYE